MRERILKFTFFGLLAAHLVVIVWFLYTAMGAVYRTRDIPQQARIFTIPSGASLNDVLVKLQEAGLGPEPIYVRLALARESADIVVKKGNYQLPERASTREILQLFQEGKVLLYKLTLPEGLDRWQTATLLGASRWGSVDEFTALIDDPALITDLDPDATDLEGYLFPETYFLPQEATAREVVATLVNHFKSRTKWLRQDVAQRGLTVREWVAFASLVEEESSLAEERPTIASVFENRLKRGIMLQCDPTIIYALKLKNRYRGKIYRSDIRHDHPYNTYVYKGIPPGPIASPSLDSLDAVINPAETPYLFFVAKNDGSHYFSKTLKEHNRAVKRYLGR